MPKIDPHQSWLPLEARAAAEPNARRRGLLIQVRNHMEQEIKGQIDLLMETLTAHPVYHFWGNAPVVLEGQDAVRNFYLGMFARGGQQFEVVVERIVVDDDTVITEGQVKQVQTGASLLATHGRDTIDGQPLAPDDLVLTTTQLVTVWPADAEGKLIGEDIYFGHEPLRNAEIIHSSDLPDYYRI